MSIRVSPSRAFTRKARSPEILPGHTFNGWPAYSNEHTAHLLHSSLDSGLKESELDARRQLYGRNHLTPSTGRSTLMIAIDQFRSLIVALLLVATVLAWIMGDSFEAAMVLVVILLNALIGFFTEWKAQRTLLNLQACEEKWSKVIRDSAEQRIAAQELVPGDLVLLEAGDRVPADGRIVVSHSLLVDESALTGESIAMSKSSAALSQSEMPLAELANMGFMGTSVVSGHGRMLVTSIGGNTQIGQIGCLVGQTEKRSSPLTTKLQHLGTVLVVIVIGLCAVMLIFGYLRGLPFLEMLKVAISLAIAAVPEGLLAVTTVTLAIGMQRMAGMGALIRNLGAVETLGATTTICTDKTGTLTRNEMTVETIVVGDRIIQVDGIGYGTKGRFLEDARIIDTTCDPLVFNLLRIGVLCNDASVWHDAGKHTITGDPTEAALIVLAEKAALDLKSLRASSPRVSETPFTCQTKQMVTVHRSPDRRQLECAKGAPSQLLRQCECETWSTGYRPLTQERRQWWEDSNTRLANNALRVLGLAYRETRDMDSEVEDESTPGWVFAGLVGIIDPLRDEAHEAISLCRTAGIATVMITGDQIATAQAIGRRLGIDRSVDGKAYEAIHAQSLAQISAQTLGGVLARTAVIARAEPRHKLQIVHAFQQMGHVVAMTGDGVNDAPALKQADIGIAMGISGTDVARQTADMVITDDNFSTIVKAVEQGRILYANIIHFVHYLLSCNLAELLTVFLAIMGGLPLPLVPLQILWLNMITDVFPALALALEPSSPDVMKRGPRAPDSALLPPALMMTILGQGVLLASATLVAFYIALQNDSGAGHDRAVTVAFMTLGLVQILHAFNTRSRHRSLTHQLFTNGWLWTAVMLCVMLQLMAVYQPYMNRVLGTVPLGGSDWWLIITCSLAPVAIVELSKWTRQTLALLRSKRIHPMI